MIGRFAVRSAQKIVGTRNVTFIDVVISLVLMTVIAIGVAVLIAFLVKIAIELPIFWLVYLIIAGVLVSAYVAYKEDLYDRQSK